MRCEIQLDWIKNPVEVLGVMIWGVEKAEPASQAASAREAERSFTIKLSQQNEAPKTLNSSSSFQPEFKI